MSYDGAVITGWGALARTPEDAHKVVQDLIDSKGSLSYIAAVFATL
jgi:hypothetical protein